MRSKRTSTPTPDELTVYRPSFRPHRRRPVRAHRAVRAFRYFDGAEEREAHPADVIAAFDRLTGGLFAQLLDIIRAKPSEGMNAAQLAEFLDQRKRAALILADAAELALGLRPGLAVHRRVALVRMFLEYLATLPGEVV